MIKIICSNTTNPYLNLATEEYLFKETDESYLFLYINDISVIIGKNQNLYTEVSTEYIKKNHIPIIRRLSGGGAVVHDKGNLNFSIIQQQDKNRSCTFSEILEPIKQFLEDTFRINVKTTNRNALEVNNKKVSGTAFSFYRDRLLGHGTLLIKSDLNKITKILMPTPHLFEGRRVKSKNSRMRNLGTLENIPKDIESFKEKMIDYFTKRGYKISSYTKEVNLLRVKELVVKKYSSWEWNIANGPDFIFHIQEEKTYMFHVKKGIITHLKENNKPIRFKLSELEKWIIRENIQDKKLKEALNKYLF